MLVKMAKCKLGDICEIVSGSTPKTNIDEYWDGDIKWITPAELDDDTYIITDSVRKITELGVRKTGLSPIPEGTVILSSRAPIGKVAIAGCEMYCNQGFKNLICSNKISNKYLYWFLKGKKALLNALGRGATFKEISKSIVSEIEINVPDLVCQNEVVKTLEKVNSIISLRKQELHALDNLIKARFVEMFGDPIKNPKGWKVATIGDVVTEVRYGTSKPAVEGGKYPYLRMNNITLDGHLDLNDLKYIDIPDDEIEKCVVRKGDVLFNRTNSVELVGKTAFFDLPQDMVIAGYIIRLRLSEKMLPEVLVQYMNLEALKKILRSMAKGAVNQANINAQELQSIKLYIPDMDLQKQFIEMKGQVDKSKSISETHIFYAEKSITPTTPKIFLKGRCIYGNEF